MPDDFNLIKLSVCQKNDCSKNPAEKPPVSTFYPFYFTGVHPKFMIGEI